MIVLSLDTDCFVIDASRWEIFQICVLTDYQKKIAYPDLVESTGWTRAMPERAQVDIDIGWLSFNFNKVLELACFKKR